MNTTPSMGSAPTTTANPLVVQGEATKATEGLGIFHDAAEAVDAADKGNWTEGLLNAGGMAMGIAGFAADPLAGLISAGFGWLMEHVPFLKEPLDWLTGDQETLDGMTKTWGEVSNHLQSVSTDLKGWVANDTGGWSGLDVDSYKGFGADRAETYNAVAVASQGISVLINVSKTILNVVRGIVRDIISEAVGKLVSIMLRWVPAMAAFGAGVAGAIAEAIPTAVKYANKALGWCKKLSKAFSNATGIFKKLEGTLGKAQEALTRKGGDAVDALRRSSTNDVNVGSAFHEAKKVVVDGMTGLPQALVPKTAYDLAKETGKVIDHEWQSWRHIPEQGKKE